MHESIGFPQFSHAAISSVVLLMSRSYILTVKVIILLHCKGGFRWPSRPGAIDHSARDSLLSCFCQCLSLKLYQFVCPACSFESRNLAGTPDGDQILTDLNTEFAQYAVFGCPAERKFLTLDILDTRFDGNCPSDGASLQEQDPGQVACPRCGAKLIVTETKPLSAGDAAVE